MIKGVRSASLVVVDEVEVVLYAAQPCGGGDGSFSPHFLSGGPLIRTPLLNGRNPLLQPLLPLVVVGTAGEDGAPQKQLQRWDRRTLERSCSLQSKATPESQSVPKASGVWECRGGTHS